MSKSRFSFRQKLIDNNVVCPHCYSGMDNIYVFGIIGNCWLECWACKSLSFLRPTWEEAFKSWASSDQKTIIIKPSKTKAKALSAPVVFVFKQIN